jgi:hypothetical protein
MTARLRGEPPRLLRVATIGDGILLCPFFSTLDAREVRRVCRVLHAAVTKYRWPLCLLSGQGRDRFAGVKASFPLLDSLRVVNVRASENEAVVAADDLKLPAALTRLEFNDVYFAPGAALAIASLARLRRLDIYDVELAGGAGPFVLDLSLLAGCRQLQALSCNVSGDQLTLLAGLPIIELTARAFPEAAIFGDRQVDSLLGLESLTLAGNFEFMAAPASFARSFNQLRELKLRIFEAGLFTAAHLRALKLSKLSINGCEGVEVTNEWFAALTDTEDISLRGIDIVFTHETPQYLSNMASLHLEHVRLTDESMGHFRNVTALVLKRCDLRGLTGAGLRKPPLRYLRTDDQRIFRQACHVLPHATVSYGEDSDED